MSGWFLFKSWSLITWEKKCAPHSITPINQKKLACSKYPLSINKIKDIRYEIISLGHGYHNVVAYDKNGNKIDIVDSFHD